MDKIDYKKAFKELYQPRAKPSKILVPEMTFLMVDGKGDPNMPDGEFAEAVSLLYALAYTIKMSKMGGRELKGYVDYVVPPLEGFWAYDDGGLFRFGGNAHFIWTAVIRQPDFVTSGVLEWAVSEVHKKKPGLDASKARLETFEEGLCVQCLHVGPYATEPETVEKMNVFMRENALVPDFSAARRHHEIYLGDPRKSDPAKLKTVVRHPVKATT
ncbi:GyrI-like domain-containing protein [Oscillospiraceae bacterium CM]|nr:GyrI-like domain-containing protein [Oscillospiraceae bacterium CM]